MTFVWVLLGVIAFILAPIIALKPRGKQSRLEKLRMLAREKGARYSMRRLPPLKTEINNPEVRTVYSIQPAKQLVNQAEWILRRTDYVHDVNFFKDWDWANEHRPIQSVQTFLIRQLDDLPESVVGISAGGAGISFFWKEETDEQTLLKMLDFLRQIQDFYA